MSFENGFQQPGIIKINLDKSPDLSVPDSGD